MWHALRVFVSCVRGPRAQVLDGVTHSLQHLFPEEGAIFGGALTIPAARRMPLKKRSGWLGMLGGEGWDRNRHERKIAQTNEKGCGTHVGWPHRPVFILHVCVCFLVFLCFLPFSCGSDEVCSSRSRKEYFRRTARSSRSSRISSNTRRCPHDDDVVWHCFCSAHIMYCPMVSMASDV